MSVSYIRMTGNPAESPEAPRGAPTRERLVAATVDALRAHGAAGLTSREITRRAGVNLQAITYHFGAKDQLVAEALTALVRTRLAPIRDALEAGGDPAERMLGALQTINRVFAASGEDLELYADAIAAASTNGALAASLGALHAELVTYLAGLIRELARDGYLERWVDPEAMAALLVAIGDGVATQAHFGPPDVGAVLDQVGLLLLAARDRRKRVWPSAARAMLRRMRRT